MKSAILISTIWMLVTSASVVPIDESSSTVNVKQGSNEYSYHIQQGHGVAAQPGLPLPLLKSSQSSHIILNSLQSKSSGGTDEKADAGEQPLGELKDQPMMNEASDQSQGRSNEIQPYEQLRIALPGYQLMPDGSDSGLIKESLEKQLKIALPGYQLIPDGSDSGLNKEGLEKQLKIALPGYQLIPDGSHSGLIKEGLEKQLKIALPGYQLLPGAGVTLIKEGMEKQRLQEGLKIALPGYRLLPANPNIQYTDLPYYYPYLHGYGLQYPHNLPLVRYI